MIVQIKKKNQTIKAFSVSAEKVGNILTWSAIRFQFVIYTNLRLVGVIVQKTLFAQFKLKLETPNFKQGTFQQVGATYCKCGLKLEIQFTLRFWKSLYIHATSTEIISSSLQIKKKINKVTMNKSCNKSINRSSLCGFLRTSPLGRRF